MLKKTPLGQVLGLGSAKAGTEHWWRQRVTAIAGIPLVVFLIGYLLMHRGASRAEIVASMHNPMVAILMGLTILNLVWHMRLGLQVVIEDYVRTGHTKYALMLLNTFFAWVMALAGVYAILKMSFGL
ncbi:MAG: succinate dehydrogenase, hydrophobic membrane anchor protein [Aestuariivirga sp.]|uniref:succinate dehydrogenase, hydrophobic membrane anchor protein n=1 Tax=Aestuariivirga sp. TaxID=2650926 RepID=UPI0025C73EF0|nr:succinate dehydrogenase, hydrophobic membrane anchor protein [Aestuariivirga sp.]MCA3562684.1 succinate dehydrogenase, hydrophobic membrane anchor protein [Aestuariivirga sp.]